MVERGDGGAPPRAMCSGMEWLVQALLRGPWAPARAGCRRAWAPGALRGVLALVLLVAGWPRSAAAQAWVVELDSIVGLEVADKGFPSFGIVAVADGRVAARVVRGRQGVYGGPAATSATLYRTGSVGKTLTDLAVLISAERGLLDLDADVRRYLPSFSPENPTDEPVTLRRLMVHTAGLVREPPVGSYFDATRPSLEQTVRSLNGTALLWEPGTRTKYSNAGLAVVGRVLEVVHGEPYAALLRRLVFEPAGMWTAAVGRGEADADRLAAGVMQKPDGTTWEAPSFDLGMSPAGDLYASLDDMAAFMTALLAGDGRLIGSDGLRRMWTPDPPRESWQLDAGLGFSLNGRFAGEHRMARNGGAVYGFATELALLPDESLGVYAVAARDLANGTVQAVAHWALRAMIAERTGGPAPVYELTELPFTDLASRLSGCDSKGPPGSPAVAGTYGPAHNPLIVCWKDGRLHALIEWMFLYPLEGGEDGFWVFPSYSLYGHERLRFVGNDAGGVDAVIGFGRDGIRFDGY